MLRKAFSSLGRRGFASATAAGNKRVAVVLSGNGVYDGTECTEGVATLVWLSRAGASVQCFAPDKAQMHCVNHTAGTDLEHNRNILVESARLARGNIKPLAALNTADFDAVVFPGGFGAAKNLSTWAVDGPTNCAVDGDVDRVIKEFHSSKKVIGACCIAPVLVAKSLCAEAAAAKQPVKLTVGGDDTSAGSKWPWAGTVGQLAELGSGVQHVAVDGLSGPAVVDEVHRVVTAPAYMFDGQPHEVFDSVGHMVDGVMGLLKKL